ncbi:MAG: glycoside hydrolase family 3 N-terminal domain-containing protein [Bacteroidota bacterium]
MKSTRAFLFIIFLLIGGHWHQLLGQPNAKETLPDSIDIKIGQMILIGYRGIDFKSDDPVVNEIKNGRVGGIILFESNISKTASADKLKNLISGLQKIAPIPLFMSIDQEGGVVNRLKPKYGFPKSVTAAYLGKLDNSDSTKYYAQSMAKTLKALGFNLNFAPVLDLNINPENPIIAAHRRAFSTQPEIVTKHARIFIEQLSKEKIIAVGKHFPGHGSSLTDTHKGVADVTNTWQNDEIAPYRNLIKNGNLQAVMVAHIVNANLDSDRLPSTLSKKTINGLLKDSLQFNGVTFSDDMQMRAVSKHYHIKKAIELGINAGLDVLTLSIDLTNKKGINVNDIHSLIKELINEGKITKTRIDQSYRRIMILKKAYLYDKN